MSTLHTKEVCNFLDRSLLELKKALNLSLYLFMYFLLKIESNRKYPAIETYCWSDMNSNYSIFNAIDGIKSSCIAEYSSNYDIYQSVQYPSIITTKL